MVSLISAVTSADAITAEFQRATGGDSIHPAGCLLRRCKAKRPPTSSREASQSLETGLDRTHRASRWPASLCRVSQRDIAHGAHVDR